MTAYSPETVDTFSISVESGVTCVLLQGTLPLEKYKALYELCFAVYSPVVLTVNLTDRFNISYTIAQKENWVDLDWLFNALSRFEEGWVHRDNILLSPNPSKLSQTQIIETFNIAGCLPS